MTNAIARRIVTGLVALALACSAAQAGTAEAPLDVRRESPASKLLAAAPTADKVGDVIKVRFETVAAADVEVAVLDASGRVVRHLAAGLLGPNAPAPLKKDALAQEIVWDGKDDLGRAAGGGPFKIRVRCGASGALEKVLGWDGNTLDPIRGLVVGAGGELYVLLGSWVSRGRTEMRVLDRNGKYLRTIMPYPAGAPAEKTRSVGHLIVDNQRLPIVFNGHAHSLYPLTPGLRKQSMAWNPKGHVVAVSTLGTAFEHGLPRHLLAFDPRGGVPAGVSFVGPELRTPVGLLYGEGEGNDPCFDHLAVSPDGKCIYYVPSSFASRHAVYRLHWGEDKGAGIEAAFLGEVDRPGSDPAHLNDPQGLAIDAKGNIYVCDRGNGRVMVFAPDGKALGQFAVEDPEQIAVHPASGQIYVACRQVSPGGRPKDVGPLSMEEYKAWRARQAERTAKLPARRPPKLVKFAAWGQGPPKKLAEADLAVDLMALDGQAEPPLLWASLNNRLTPIRDAGDKFEAGEAVNTAAGLVYPGYIVADPAHNRVLVYELSAKYKVRAVDLATGQKSEFIEGVSEIAMAPDGSFYGVGKYGENVLLRFDAAGKPLPFAGADTNRLPTGPNTMKGVGLGHRGLCVAPNGDIYLMRNNTEKAVPSRVDVYGPDGKLKRAGLIDGLGLGDCGLGVDPAGNVYIGANVKPRDRLFQEGFEGQVPPTDWLCWAAWRWHYRPAPWHYSMRNEYLYHWGAAFKFPPEGGAFYGRGRTEYPPVKDAAPLASLANAPAGATEYVSGYLYHPVRVSGALWRYAGMGIVPSSERLWGDPACVCMTSRLAVDGFGRVFVPNCFRFCVEMLDTNGNRIARIGRYGNADDAGPGVHFAWPAFVATADGKLYVSDSVNRRVTVVRMDYAAVAQCDVP